MSKKKLNGDGITYENQGGVLVVDIEGDDGLKLRFIFEDSFSYMVARLKGNEVEHAGSVFVEDVLESMAPPLDGEQ